MTFTLVWAGGAGSFEVWRPVGVLLDDFVTPNPADVQIALGFDAAERRAAPAVLVRAPPTGGNGGI